MTSTATPETSSSDSDAKRRVRWLPGLIECAASLLAIYSMGALLINKADASVAFFGETPTVTPANVATYQQWLAMLGVAVAISFASALWRTRLTGRSTYWHGLVLVAGLVAAGVFHVAIESSDPEPVPVQDRSGTVCHSGGDNSECVGG